MMRSFELPRHRRANVWLDEPPPADFTATSFVTRILQPRVVIDGARSFAGVEINISHGPRASYGVLGAELVESSADGLEVVVSINKVGLPFRPSLALQPDEVQVGLLEEYANAVVGGVAKVAESIGAPTKASLFFFAVSLGCTRTRGLVAIDLRETERDRSATAHALEERVERAGPVPTGE